MFGRQLTRMRATALGLAACAVLGLGIQGCSDDDDDVIGAGPVPGPAVIAVVLDYRDELVQNVPAEVRGEPAGVSRINGLIQLGQVPSGTRVLAVGDSVTTPTLLVPFTGDPAGSFIDRPIYLPDLESGIGANIPSSIATVTTISGNELPGVTLRLDAGTSVSSFTGEVRVIGVSPSRLPIPVRGGTNSDSEPRAAYLVEPHGVAFNPPATLRVPRLESLGNGPFDGYKVDVNTGQWVQHATNVAAVGSGQAFFDIPADDGTLYAVVPRTTATTVTLTGRIVAGTNPVEGFRASCWNRVSDATGPDGTFEIQNVPNVYGVFLVRAHPDKPGVEFAPEVVATTSLNTSLGDIQVLARPPDLLRPTIKSTSPSDDSTNISRSTQIVVTFSEAIDPAKTRPYRVTGPKGDVSGQFNFDNTFTVRFRPEENLDPSADYTILVDRTVTDLAGNALNDEKISFSFRTRGGAPDPPPTDTLAFGLDPLSGGRGDTVLIPGRNYTGGSVVAFGGTNGLVKSETTDLIEVEVPDFEPAADVTVSISAGGVGVGTLLPLVFDLRASVATIFSGSSPDEPLVFLDRASPPLTVVIDGSNVGGASVTIDGIAIAAVDSTVLAGGSTVATGRTLNLSAPAPATLLTGPVVVRGANGKPSRTYRFLQVRD